MKTNRVINLAAERRKREPKPDRVQVTVRATRGGLKVTIEVDGAEPVTFAPRSARALALALTAAATHASKGRRSRR